MGDQLLLHCVKQPGTTENLEYIETLLDSGHASIEARTATGTTPLYEAITYSSRNPGADHIIELLLKRGANVNAYDACTRQSCAFQAVSLNEPILLKVLLERGADVQWRDRQHQNLWHKCALIPERLCGGALPETSAQRHSEASKLVPAFLNQKGNSGNGSNNDMSMNINDILNSDINTIIGSLNSGGDANGGGGGGTATSPELPQSQPRFDLTEIMRSFNHPELSCALILAQFGGPKCRETVDWLDVDGHNASYWAKMMDKPYLKEFLKWEMGSEPHKYSSSQLLEMVTAAAAADKKKKAPKKGAKKKK